MCDVNVIILYIVVDLMTVMLTEVKLKGINPSVAEEPWYHDDQYGAVFTFGGEAGQLRRRQDVWICQRRHSQPQASGIY